MPNSLKTKLSKLRHKGQITNEEYQELITKLDGHDAEVRAEERRKFAEWLDKNEHLFCHCKKGNETNIECVLREYGKEQK